MTGKRALAFLIWMTICWGGIFLLPKDLRELFLNVMKYVQVLIYFTFFTWVGKIILVREEKQTRYEDTLEGKLDNLSFEVSELRRSIELRSSSY